MTTRISHGPRWAVLAAVLLYAAGGVFSNAHAQVNTNITADGTLGTRVTPTGNVFNIDGGTIRGGNQFHSFGQFSVGTGNTANFSVANTIQNIISRVTGGVRSQIDGTLTSTITGDLDDFERQSIFAQSCRHPVWPECSAQYRRLFSRLDGSTTLSSGPMAFSTPIRRKQAC